MPSLVTFNEPTAQRIADTVRRNYGKNEALPAFGGPVSLGGSGWYWGELLTDVAAPTNGWTAPTRGYAKLMVPDPASIGVDDPVHFHEFGTGTISDATNASPIVITSAAHGLRDGTPIYIKDVVGNTAANGFARIQNRTTDTFELAGSTGNAAYVSGGTWYVAVPFTNRDPSLATTSRAICKLEYGYGEWSLKWVGC